MEPFLGEIRMFSYRWAPKGWALCNGAELKVAQNPALFSLIGNKYGGDGKITFNLPDLRGQTPLGYGESPVSGTIYLMGKRGGTETVTLTVNQMPAHTHATNVMTTAGNFPVLGGNLFAVPGKFQIYPTTPIYAPRENNPPVPLNSDVVSASGGAPHTNMQPWAVTNFCIAMIGNYPTRPF